ncbi:hypothetical protein TVAG_495920 [Trichomonas vaginalis G3]|uniref:Uncharacterized protein n=1 Tax=Trichomonas vaginalis (strain ATCC PRA-98 / G3) TaxID=412133 RepID=A2DVN1_TRIV3|nr:hypothetical protein TVAGG3_0276060 [Trichomonas vaginalis G3]EAY15573.1 hypothetical protein TVAG_495920 [Trichomonas vaginalis G3]KAI5526219.1 hypothetical protein TVAGG3_0276060 [Trichomonas vaginalis G3]|eukprot:XP_001327796.1 hypothetical protein [Trichomonas vaginalis G3]
MHSLNDTMNLQKIAKFIYQQNVLQFSKEIVTKIHAIKSQIKKEGIEILYQIAKDLNLNIDDKKMLIDERFLMSVKRNPDLLFNKELCIDAFNEYVAFAPYQFETKSSKEIEFGIGNISKFNLFTYAASNDQRSLYVKLANSTILAHILYTLLIARPLIIKTNDTQRFLNMAAKLTCFIPNFKISNVIIRDTVNPVELSEGMICIAKDVEYDNIENVSILSIDQNFYEGVMAEKDSVIMDFSRLEPAQSSPYFLFTAYFKAHQLFNKIELCISKTDKENKSEYNIYKSLINIGIKRCDYHLVSKWFRLLGYNDESELLLRHAPPIQKGACFF